MPNTTGPWWLPAADPCKATPHELRNPPSGYWESNIGFGSEAEARDYQSANCGNSPPVVTTGNPEPGQPTDPTPGKYPQWGVTNPGGNLTSPGDKIAEAHDSAEKVRLIDQGYVVWFPSRQAAENFIKGETGPFNGNIPNPLSGIAEVGATLKAFFTEITDWRMWASLGWTLLGAFMMILGLYLLVRLSKGYKRAESAALGVVSGRV